MISGQGTFKGFAEFMDEVIERDLAEPLNEGIAEVVLNTHSAAISKSPVQTGRFQSAWRVTVSKRSQSNPTLPTSRMRSESKATGKRWYNSELSASTRSANTVMNRFSILKHRKVFITNNVPYGTYIEEGGRNIRPHKIAAKSGAKLDRGIAAVINKIV